MLMLILILINISQTTEDSKNIAYQGWGIQLSPYIIQLEDLTQVSDEPGENDPMCIPMGLIIPKILPSLVYLW